MLLAYILCKDRIWRKKVLFGHKEGVFTKGSFEYDIDGDCVYFRKILGIKLVRSINYVEGCRDPISFSTDGISFKPSDIPLKECAMIIRKALQDPFIIAILVCVILSLILSLVTSMKVFGMLEGQGGTV